jgi:hypothetical protein
MVANIQIVTIVHAVRVRSIIKCLALAAIVLGVATGCSGLNTTQSFSPLMFFLPGLVENKPGSPQIVPIMKTGSPAQIIASNRDSAKVN